MDVVNRSFENVVKFKYLNTTPTNKMCFTSIASGSNGGASH
jgi:hypothetical protein